MISFIALEIAKDDEQHQEQAKKKNYWKNVYYTYRSKR